MHRSFTELTVIEIGTAGKTNNRKSTHFIVMLLIKFKALLDAIEIYPAD